MDDYTWEKTIRKRRVRRRRQALLVRRDPEAALAAIPALLSGLAPADRRRAADFIAGIVTGGDALSVQERHDLQRVLALFGQHAPPARPGARTSRTPGKRAGKRPGKPASTATGPASRKTP